MRFRSRSAVAAAAGVIVVVCSVDGGASSAAPDGAVIANRPAVHTLPAGCGPAGKKLQCNPLTNAGCDRAKDEACDDDEHGGFGCYPGPNPGKDGETCDDDEGCQGGLGCDMEDGEDDGVCARYCCTDADCGSKRCAVIKAAFGSLGFCN